MGANQAPKTVSELVLDIPSIRTPPAQNSTPPIDLSSTHSEQETLEPWVIWCIGEYGDLLVNNGTEDPITVTGFDLNDVIEDAITCHNSDMRTKAMALATQVKLSSRVPSISE
ncbi:PREDICTED: AP-1 complex subunit gamma-1-like [Camelina sativa]|uniref:AP-1 complex subunit gamma-1-like n=1 Tax=Camelina sativa TaxID=90675 RepID=A0ABM0VY32_CAMSA|nr:PREDICTED: AP-1 complex subunit gamma-1-like [Camelina sativa]